MLIEFSVENYRSIRERQTLSLVASSANQELEACNSFASLSNARLLKSCVLYGPNASGKSTLISALSFLKDCILNSHKESQADEEIDVHPFKLDRKYRLSDSEFEIIFIQNSVRFEYGFKCNKQRFTEEWLFAYPLGKPQKWFHRIFDIDNQKYLFEFKPSFEGGKTRQSIADATRSNALYLSTAIQLNNNQLKDVFDWFKTKLRVIKSAHDLAPIYTIKMLDSDLKGKNKVLSFLSSADLSISDIKIKKTLFNSDMLPLDLPQEIREDILKNFNGKDVSSVKFIHSDIETSEEIEFDADEESEGTHTLFAFAGPWIDVIEKSRILVVDELDNSLHPLIVQHLIKKFHLTNSSTAQIIFTTHDTSLLSQSLLRRDQVWFMEKDSSKSTNLYSLSEFSPQENEAIERGYLNGRYGGIPFLKDLDFYGN